MATSAFVDVKEKTFAGEEAAGTSFSNVAAMQIGSGSKVFRGDQSGIWLGAEKWADAPFRVDMNGNLTATSLTITGYIPTGGAAADVNGGVTSISAAKINISGATTFTSGYDPTSKVAMVGGNYTSTAATASKVQIFPDANTGIVAYASNGTSVVFKVVVGGTDVGDVIIGNYGGGSGAKWDQSAGTLKIKGNIEAGTVEADTLIGDIDEDRIIDNVLTALQSKLVINSTNYLSAIVNNVGSITAGTITGVTVSSSSGTNRIVLNTGDYVDFYLSGSLKGRLRGTAGKAGGIKVVDGDFAIENNYSLLLENTGGTDFGRLGMNPSNQLVMVMPSGNQFFLKNSAEDVNLFTVSNTMTYSERGFACNSWGSFAGDVDLNGNKLTEVSGIDFNSTGSDPSSNTGLMWFRSSSGSYYLRMYMGTKQQFDTHGV